MYIHAVQLFRLCLMSILEGPGHHGSESRMHNVMAVLMFSPPTRSRIVLVAVQKQLPNKLKEASAPASEMCRSRA